jgi:predicted permease
MRWISKASLRIKSLFRRSAVDRELDDEMRFHLERQVAANIEAGMSPREARNSALREFGAVEQYKEECRDMRRANWLLDFFQDLRFGVRMLSKSPAFTSIAILTLALGIGANTAIYSLTNAVLFNSLKVQEPKTLYLLQWSARTDPNHASRTGYGDCQDREKPIIVQCSFPTPFFNKVEGTGVFAHFATFAGAPQMSLSGNGPATTVDNAEYVSGDYFETLGIHAEAGRLIAPADDTISAAPVVVLTYGCWKSKFGASQSAIGKTINLNRVAFMIIGVAQRNFDSMAPGEQYQMWIPISTAQKVDVPWDNRDADPNNYWMLGLARLKPGVTARQAEAQLTTMFANDETHGAKAAYKAEDDPRVRVVPAASALTGESEHVEAPIMVLLAAVGVVLLIACGNVAGLLLARASARQKEIAVRLALGAGRGRIARQLLAENMILAICGGGIGVLLSMWLSSAIYVFLTADSGGEPLPFDLKIDARVLTFTIAISVLTGLVFGLAPILRSLRVDLTPALKDSADTLQRFGSRRRWVTLGSALVVGEVTLTIVLLAAAGLLVRTLYNLRNVNAGFDESNIVTFRVEPALAGYKGAEIPAFYQQLQERVAAMPGVRSATYSWIPLLGGGLWTTGFHLPGDPKDKDSDSDMMTVGPDFFETMKIPMKLGRKFGAEDYAIAQRLQAARDEQDERMNASLKIGTQGVAEANQKTYAGLPPLPVLVNDAFVRQYLPKKEPIGFIFGNHGPEGTDLSVSAGWQIVGIVADAKYNNLRRDVQPTIYAPLSGGGATFSVRTTLALASFSQQVRGIVGQMNADLPVYRIRTEEQQINGQLMAERLITRLSSAFGILALVLASVGLYGLLAFEVSRRTREIGIRMALGAKTRDVLRMVIVQGLALAGVGAVVGVAAAWGVTRLMADMLFGVKAADPVTYAVVVAMLAIVAFFACYVPARRAMRVDPMVALRYE